MLYPLSYGGEPDHATACMSARLHRQSPRAWVWQRESRRVVG